MKAAKIIVPSLNTKKDVMRILHVPEEKIVVVYNGVEHEKFKQLDCEHAKEYLKSKYGISGGFILSVVGTFIPRKNVLRLLSSYHKLPNDVKSKYQLIIIGKKQGSLYDQVLETIHRLKLDDRVILTGYVPEEDLPLFYNAASLFVFLSLYEGFGLPPSEAMACGTPVIVSKISSLPEIVGDAGLTVDPYNVDEITRILLLVLKNDLLKRDLKKKGLRQAKLYSWKSSADKYIHIFESQ
jgi:glycosyltransferase involved in cell wall biosynthesis